MWNNLYFDSFFDAIYRIYRIREDEKVKTRGYAEGNSMKKAILILVFVLFAFNCGKKADSEKPADPFALYLEKQNELRKEHGLPLSGKNWEFHRYNDNQFQWTSPDYDKLCMKGIPFLGSVATWIEDGVIGEEDYCYYSGKTFIDEAGKVEEQLALVYTYSDFQKGENPWSWTLHGKVRKDGKDPKEALKILASWGFTDPVVLPELKKKSP